MPSTVFFSWQSDRPAKVTRTIIKQALEAAIRELNADIEEADRPSDEKIEIDHDTKGLPGTPDIAASILNKIEAASVFVADVTPIGLSDPPEGKRPKHLPNPNVLIELGYAKRALTTDRVIQVWNTSFTNCAPEDLPFDMRGRRGPIDFALPADSDKPARDLVIKGLTKAFRSALEPILKMTRPVADAPERWALTDENDISIWPIEGGKIVINEPDHGSGEKRIFPPPRSFVRILPAQWSGSDDLDRHDLLLGMSGGFSWGATKGGVVTYPGSILFSDTEKVKAITKRFPKTGELWATRTDVARKFGEHLCIYGDTIPKDWATYLRYAAHHIAEGGGALPFRVRLGVAGLGALHWPSDTGFGARPHAALEDDLELTYTLKSIEPADLWDVVQDAWIRYRRVFSLPNPGVADMQMARAHLGA